MVTIPISEAAKDVVSAGFNKDDFQQFADPNNRQDKGTEDTVFDPGPSGFDTSAWKTNG